VAVASNCAADAFTLYRFRVMDILFYRIQITVSGFCDDGLAKVMLTHHLDFRDTLHEFIFIGTIENLDVCDRRSAFCQCPCLVKDHSIYFCKVIYYFPALDEYAFPCAVADTCHVCDRSADYQGAGTCDDKECNRQMQVACQQIHDDCKYYDEGGIVVRKSVQEFFSTALFLLCILHEFDDLRKR